MIYTTFIIMVFVREIKKGGKVYRYLYKSKRVDGKVKSIYVGREEVKHFHKVKHKASKKVKHVSKVKSVSKKVHKKNSLKHNVVHSKSDVVHHVKKDDKWIVDRIIEFNKLMEESMDLVIGDRIEAAANHYNKLLVVYNKLSMHVGEGEKVKLYDKTKQIYDRIQELNS